MNGGSVKQENAHKAEINWKDLRRKPGRLFGFSYFYFIAVILILGYMYITELTLLGTNSVIPPYFPDSAYAVKDIPLQSARVIPPLDIKKVAAPTQALLTKGKELFEANCASCHGTDGKGDGPASGALLPKPRNFTILTGWVNGSKVSQVYKTLEEGISGSGMASYSYMLPEDRFALIHYVRSFAQGQPVDSDEELNGLETTYHLSKGLNVRGQIPVKKAMKLIAEESLSRSEMLTEILKDASAAKYPLFSKLASNGQKVLVSLSHDRKALSSRSDFRNFVALDPVSIGFRPEVARIGSEDWKNLYDEINQIMKEPK